MSLTTDVRPQVPVPVSAIRNWKRAIRAALQPNNSSVELQPNNSSVDQASFNMLSLYRANLEVRLRTIDSSSLSDSQLQDFVAVTDMLKAPANPSVMARNVEWDKIYKAESMVLLLFSGPQLREEINTRLQQLTKDDPREAETLRRNYDALLKEASTNPANGSPSDAMLRTLLLRILEALHWSAKKTYLARPIRIEATNRIVLGLLVSFLLLVLPYVILNVDFARPEISKWWSMFAIYTALTAGLLGAFFSRLISMEAQWAKLCLDEIFQHREWPYTLLRAGVGVCGALIVYFFLRSGIAEGALFPAFDQIKIELVNIGGGDAVPMAYVMPSKSLALLTFWCFLAGFSEKLVPNILNSTERQLAAVAESQPVSRT
jgi:hypothetical protein